MIDCENEVYTRVASQLRISFPGINISGEYVRTPTSFPHVSLVMSDSYPIQEFMDNDAENITQVMFEINIYSNKENGKKLEVKNIATVIDNIMSDMNMRRISMTPVPNLEDATIYRLTIRYQVATDGKYFYRR